mmetsp:Transcript_44257/g.112977  ORF Transcript_44257/g.112977 Transcript_44257/m.112977 type:complete len:160 (+) Transcript_44257:175-654(+)|eukprot:jgi/Tetstr1/438781/TSEL_027290.t1
MADLAAASNGGKVILATCYDERFPPESVIDGQPDGFWATTGLFPQEIVVALPEVSDVRRITTNSLHVRKIVVETCGTERPTSFEKAYEAELSNTKGAIQTETHQINARAKFVKIIIESGYKSFAGLSKLAVIGDGEAVSSGGGGGGGGYGDGDSDGDGF